MKINRIIWRNFKGLPDGEIVANGRNVTISGRNGAGKSSIASIVPFVLFGKIAAKSFDEQGLTVEMQTPSATIEFDAVTLKRCVTANNKNRTFVDGEEVSATQFNATVFNLTGSAGALLFNPFEFPNLHWKDQRDFLLKHFAPKVKFEDVTPLVDEIKRLRKDAASLPTRIEELQRQQDDLQTGKVAELEARLTKLNTQLTEIQADTSPGKLKFLSERIGELERQREELLSRYRTTKTTCPTCGAPLPKEKVDAARAEIVTKGTQIAAKLQKLREERESLQSKVDFNVDRALQAKTLLTEIHDLNAQIAAVKQADKIRRRLERLTADEKILNARIVELEGKIATAQATRQQQMSASEDGVNAKFACVKFKLFKLLATTGEIRETCEPMLDGIPYSSLSKGEKFKAARDILNALQVKFGRVFPLMIDDAESYTSNSFVDLPNQLFLFKVTESDLEISVDESRVAA